VTALTAAETLLVARVGTTTTDDEEEFPPPPFPEFSVCAAARLLISCSILSRCRRLAMAELEVPCLFLCLIWMVFFFMLIGRL